MTIKSFILFIFLIIFDFGQTARRKTNNELIIKRLQQCDGIQHVIFKLLNTSIVLQENPSKNRNYLLSGTMVVAEEVPADLKGYSSMLFK